MQINNDLAEVALQPTRIPPPLLKRGILVSLFDLLRTRRSLSLIDQAVISVSNMATTVIIGRTCTRQQLGLYASGFSLLLLVTAIQAALIAIPYTILCPQLDSQRRHSYRGSIFLHQVYFSVLEIPFFICLAVSLGQTRSGNDLGAVFLTLSVVGGLACFRDFARRLSYAELSFAFALLIDSLASLIQLAGVCSLALAHQLNATRALLAIGLGGAASAGVWFLANRNGLQLHVMNSFRDFQVNWGLGKWLLSSSVLWSLCIDQYPWMLSTLRTSSDAAVWAVCYGVMAFLNPVVLALNNDAAPRVANEFAKNGMPGLTQTVRKSALTGAVISIPIIVCLILFGGTLVTLIYGSKYSGGVGIIVSLLAVGFGCYATGIPLPYGMLALNRPKVDFAINVICFLTFLAAGIVLVKNYGPLGAACSFFIIQSIAFLSRIVGFRSAVLSRA